MAHHWPKELPFWHCIVLSLGQMAQLIMIILAQDVFPMVHKLPIVEPIWPMLQNISQTMISISISIYLSVCVHVFYVDLLNCKFHFVKVHVLLFLILIFYFKGKGSWFHVLRSEYSYNVFISCCYAASWRSCGFHDKRELISNERRIIRRYLKHSQ